MGEDLPALLSLKSNLPVLFYKDSSPINNQIYDYYRMPRIEVPKWVKVKKLLLVTRNGDVGYIHPESVKLLRNSKKSKNYKSFKKYYVSRSNATRSSPEELTLQSILARMGFQVILPEKMSFEEQRELFTGASVVAGIHGAGLVNAVWSSKCKIIEFMPLNRINRCFEWQSMVLGHDYKRVYFDRANLSKEFIEEQLSLVNLYE
jgi:capsular polysaccharide biosynthesis protein